ncbi:MAG TPA: ATP-binding protein, partial [Planctomycetaceae bacterium]|nr:ATP-binding protein [Planctomycetaceae bacterium]
RRSRLRELLAQHCAGSEVLEAENCRAALHLANEYGSDLSETLLELADTRHDPRRITRFVSSLDMRLEFDNDTNLIPKLVCHLLEQVSTLQLLEENHLVSLSIALSEALANAMLHGNLELDSELRQEDEDIYYDLADSRRLVWPYCDRKVHVWGSYSRDRVKFVIRDDGPGFNVAEVEDPTDEKNICRVGGRGLLLIRSFMDEVFHNTRGNEITLVKYTSPAAALLARRMEPPAASLLDTAALARAV